jgi:RimJ/RimL family protein N-acetyltransferase
MLFESQRLFVREFTESDADAAFRFYGDPEIMKYIGAGNSHITEDKKLLSMQRRCSYYKEHPGYGVWAVVEKQNGELIGHTALVKMSSKENPEIELAYLIRRDKWGNGFATEIARSTLAFGFERLGLEKILAVTHQLNANSYRVLEKCGMKRTGTRDYTGVSMFEYMAQK